MNNLVYKNRVKRIRRKLKRVNTDRLRLTVFRSSRNISAQIVDDKKNITLVYYLYFYTMYNLKKRY